MAERADRLVVYFNSTRDGTRDLYVAERNVPTDVWGVPRRADDLSSSADDSDPFPSMGHSLILFGSHRPGQGSGDLWQAMRADRTVPFDPPRPIDELNSIDDEGGPWLADDLRVIYFHSNRNGARSIYMATRQ